LLGISNLEKETLELNKKLFNEEDSLFELISKEKSIELLNIELPNWNRNYNESSEIEKRQMLGRIIKKIILKKGSFDIFTKDYVELPAIISHHTKK
jgi:hypothetical protein